MANGRSDDDFSGQGQPPAVARVRKVGELFRTTHGLSADVSVWLARIADERPEECLDVLSDAERGRAHTYVMTWVRDQFVVSRGVLRRVLGHALRTDAKRIELITREDGKPVLADESRGLHFNVAHSGGWVAVAVAGADVGVDLETVREVPYAADLVKRFFAPEEQRQYAGLPGERKPAGFLRGWTCKEAVLKGVGAGMRAVDACAVCLDPTLPPRLIAYRGRPEGERWGLGTWTPAEGIVAAVAVKGASAVQICI
jgi:4'-phosphopantetheinyl transferase